MTTPDTTTLRDSLGTAVFDLDNQALFRFEQPEGDEDGSGNEIRVEPLSRAARSSASYPGAFEPSFVGIGDSSHGPEMSRFLGAHSSRW